jgi:hypothetical protein
MPKKRFGAEQIVTLLRQIEVSMAQGKPTPVACRDAGIPTFLQLTTRALAQWLAVLSRCHPSRRPFESANPETAAGDVLPVHDPGHFAIDPDLFHVELVAGNLEFRRD